MTAPLVLRIWVFYLHGLRPNSHHISSSGGFKYGNLPCFFLQCFLLCFCPSFLVIFRFTTVFVAPFNFKWGRWGTPARNGLPSDVSWIALVRITCLGGGLNCGKPVRQIFFSGTLDWKECCKMNVSLKFVSNFILFYFKKRRSSCCFFTTFFICIVEK
jgi:hypothetical protein